MQVSAMIITYSRNNKLLTKCCYITQLHRRFTFVHLSYSHLTISHSLFLFPFNTCQLLSKHREVVCNPRLHNDCGRPTTISYKTLNNTRSRYSFTAHPERQRTDEVNLKIIICENLPNLRAKLFTQRRRFI